MLRTLVIVSMLALSATAQDLNIAKAAARVDISIPWMSDGFFAPDSGGPIAALPKSNVDRGALLDAALAKAKAESKPVFWYIPRIEGVQMYRSPILDDYMRTVAFTDRHLAPLIADRFVAVRCAVDKGVLGPRFGIVAPDRVEPMIVVLSATGEVLWKVDHIRTINADWLRFHLVRLLGADAKRFTTLKPRANDPGAEALAQIATARLDMNGDESLALLAKARGIPDLAADRMAEMDLEHGLILLRLGNLKDALAMLKPALSAESVIPQDRMPEALYALATVARLMRDDNQADRVWRRLIETYPVSPEAAQAATNLVVSRDTTPVGPLIHAFEDPVWPPKESLNAAATTTAWERPASEARTGAARAVAWLLRHQNASGGWQDARYAYWDTPRIIPNVHIAVTAAAMNALLQWHEIAPKEIDAALARGEAFLASDKRMARGQNEECYADAFRLMYLAKRLPSLKEDDKKLSRLREDAAKVVKELSRQQREDGSWGHEYPNPFTSAGVAVALDKARVAGITVPDSVFTLAAKGLASVRSETGSFAYGMGRRPGKNDEALKNAMARMPVCERAILLGGGQDTAALSSAMENWWKYLPRFERIRTCDFHTDGELGGFFFWHGAYFTAESLGALPAADQNAHRAKMVEHIMRIGEWDGTWIDSHEMGKSYGTAMALLTLKLCIEDGP